MSEVTIRHAQPADTDALAAGHVAMAMETEGRQLDAQTAHRGTQRVFAHPDLAWYYVAERDGRVLGQVLITPEISDWRDGVFWWIQSVYVIPSARETGVYGALYAYVEQEARRAKDVCGLRLYVDQVNTTAQAVYRRLGMHETKYALYETDWSPLGRQS
jgi:GNAT superfamily N-acetyltransferase